MTNRNGKRIRIPSLLLPDIALSERELLIPVIHSKKSQVLELAKLLDGSSFLVKRLGRPTRLKTGAYLLMAKLKIVGSAGTPR
jgi:hypothetical protein